jgi:putative flippase GtrA
MFRALCANQFFRFLLAGGVAACVNFAVGYALQGYLPFHGDIVIGYLAGMLTAFLLFEKTVFGAHAESRGKSMAMFVVVNMLGLFQTWIVYVVLKDYLFSLWGWHFHHAPEVARAIAIVVPTLTSFVGHKYLTFAKTSVA